MALMDANFRSGKRTGWAIALLAVPLLLMGYVLSSGPAARFIRGPAWRIAYSPVISISNASSFTERVAGRYLAFWGKDLRHETMKEWLEQDRKIRPKRSRLPNQASSLRSACD